MKNPKETSPNYAENSKKFFFKIGKRERKMLTATWKIFLFTFVSFDWKGHNGMNIIDPDLTADIRGMSSAQDWGLSQWQSCTSVPYHVSHSYGSVQLCLWAQFMITHFILEQKLLCIFSWEVLGFPENKTTFFFSWCSRQFGMQLP